MTSVVQHRADGRAYSERPIVGVAAVVIAKGSVLLIQRGKEPMRGRWSLPGGMLELGESIVEGVAREALEETGVAVLPVELVEVVDRIVRDEAGSVRYHYVLLDWLCALPERSGVLRAGSDALDVLWAPLDDLGRFALDEKTVAVIERAAARAEGLRLA